MVSTSVAALVQDLRFAVRLLAKDRAFTATTVITLALGIGAATTVFTIISGMKRPLPVDEPDQIIYLQTQQVQSGRQGGVSYPDFVDWQQTTAAFTGLAAFTGGTMNVSDETQPADRLAGSFISVNAFALVRERPILGRDFGADDGQAGAAPVAILSYGVWAERYGKDSAIVGRTIRVNGVPATVVGVMREGFRFPLLADVWQPLGATPGLARDNRAARTLSVFGRLRDDMTLAQARAELATIAAGLAAAYPATNADVTIWAVPFTVQFAGRLTDAEPMLLMTAVTFVLLISCANAANLSLSRSVKRAREIALRAAIGASRGRLTRQLLVESVLLAACASALGLLLSLAGVRLFTSETADFGLPYWMDFGVDVRVFAFLAVCCLVTTMLFGLAPAWQLARTNAHDVLKEGGRGAAGSVRTRRWMGALLVGELAVTLVLLAGAGLLLRSAAVLYDADTIIDTPNVMTARVSLPAAAYPTPESRRRLHERLQERLDGMQSITSATLASAVPFLGSTSRQLLMDGEPAAAEPRRIGMVAAGDRYFDTLGVSLLRGRVFSGNDHRAGQEAAIVNERVAARFFPGENPIGRRIRLVDPGANGASTPWLTIVGIAPAIRHNIAGDAGPTIYVPLALDPPSGLAVLVRGRGAAGSVLTALRQEVHAIDRDLALYNLVSLDRVSQQSRWIPRAMSTALTIVGAIGLLLAMMGVYAVTAHGVAQRTSEIGIRMALGSQRSQVRWLFLKGALVRLGLGLAIGMAGAVAVGQLLRGFLAQTSPLDPLAFGAAIAILSSVAIIATLAPARRATRMDPVVALRHE